MRTSLAVLLLAAASLTWASESEKEIWACRTLNPQAEPMIHLVDWGSRSYVKFTHTRFAAAYEDADDARAWYWSNTGAGYYRYGILLEADGEAWVHDFSQTDDQGLSPPIDRLRCSPA